MVAHQSQLPDILRKAVPADPTFILFAGIVFLLVFAAAAAMVIKHPGSRFWSTAFAILILAMLENAVMHLAQSAIFRSYTPGVLTALLIVAPVSVWILRDFIREKRITPRSFIWMVPLAMLAQLGAIALLAWPSFRDAS
jgi:drug/metabolite transporter (DMT)-like permease